MRRSHRLAPLSLSASLLALSSGGCGVSPEFRDEPADYPEEAYEDVATPAPADPALIGRFEGTGHQSNGPSWPVSVALTDPSVGPCAVIRFPDDGCAGYWECTQVDGDRIEAVERITRGKGKCMDGVHIQATLLHGGRTLAFVAEAGSITAVGKLHRVD